MKMKRHGPAFMAIGLLFATSVHFAAAQSVDNSEFTIVLTPYAWLAGVDGDITTRGIESSVDADFTEILDATDSVLGLAGRAEVRKARFGLYLDTVYMRLGIDDLVPNLGGADVVVEQWFIDFGLLYRVGEWRVGGDESESSIAVDATLGGRYVHMGTEVDFNLAGKLEQNRDWVDPTVGAQAQFDLSRQWAMQFRGDVGGFGAASDFTWSGAGLIAWRFGMGEDAEGSIFVGYKAIGHDYETDSGFSEFGWDAIVHGPMFGMTFSF